MVKKGWRERSEGPSAHQEYVFLVFRAELGVHEADVAWQRELTSPLTAL